MVYSIIDLSIIPINSYYWDNGIIPLNCTLNLTRSKYNINSKHHFRDWKNEDDFKKLLDNIKINKPISSKKFNIGSYYIPSQPIGDIIKYEYIPKYTKLFNIYNKPFQISYLNCYTIYKLNIDVSIKIIYKNETVEHKFIIFDITKTNKGYIYKYIPYKPQIINIKDHFTIDITNILPYKNDVVHSYNNIHLMCKLI